VVFVVAAGLAVLAGLASLLRGGRYVMPDTPDGGPRQPAAADPATSQA
jgi:hypothetical protein